MGVRVGAGRVAVGFVVGALASPPPPLVAITATTVAAAAAETAPASHSPRRDRGTSTTDWPIALDNVVG